MSTPVCRSYVHFGAKCWLVSTINRESSSPYADGLMYDDTVVWEWDTEKRERVADEIVFRGEGPLCHNAVVTSLLRTGEFPKDEE